MLTDHAPPAGRVPEAPQPAPGKPRLLEQVRAALRVRHYSPATERAYVGWVRRCVLHHGMRHPLEMGEAEIDALLTDLAVRRHVSASTQSQALSALLFLYRGVLGSNLAGLEDVVRARHPSRLPVVLTRSEVVSILHATNGTPRLLATLLYGAGLRLMEGLRLRVEDVDFATHQIVVRQQHTRDLARGWGRVQLPESLAGTYPSAARERSWQWVFPACRPYLARHHHHHHHRHRHRHRRGDPARLRRGGPARMPFCNRPSRTRSGTASRPTCWRKGTISVASRNCSATPTFARP